MNTIKGFRFHPTEEELIEFLQLKNFDRDSSVQVIDEVPDICLWEPCQLAERSTLQAGDQLWYFIYSPKYKYRNSKRINRTTGEGYWKPTGIAQKIIDYKTGKVIGTKKTLVFFKGHCNDINKIKTCWVMYEYELNVAPNSIDQKTFNLCKLKKRRLDVSSTNTSQSIQYNDCESVGNQDGSTESCAEERSNQHNTISDDVVSNLSSNFVNPVAEDAISKETLHLKEMSKQCNGPKDDNGVQKLYNTIEKDDESCGSVLTNGDNTIPIERSNQHNIIVAERTNQQNVTIGAEGFVVPSCFEYLADDILCQMDFQYDEGLSLDELLELEATNNYNWIENQSIANLDNEFWNSVFADDNEDRLQEENRQQYLAAENEVSGLPCIGVTESSNSIGKPKKRPRLSHGVHVKTTGAEVGASITNQQ